MIEAEGEDPRKFAALRNRNSGIYISGGGLSMMADNIEHVLTYWVLWQTFHSPWLVGFQIMSHWLPFLLFSVYSGALAERFDCRRLIQIAQGLFMLVSLCWGILFLTGTLELWHACVLLVLHGMAGCLWSPAEQMLLYDFVGRMQLPGAIRMNATFHSLSFVAGPVIGSALLLSIGAANGMFVNILFYLPLTVFLFVTRFTGHSRSGEGAPVSVSGRLSLRSVFSVIGTVRRHRVLSGILMLTALSALTIGHIMQNAMPVFADILGAGSEGLAYGVLLFANGIGGVIGGFLLEATRKVPASPPTAVVAATLLGITTVVFAVSQNYALAVGALVIGGVAKLTSDSTEMSIVQLRAPENERGRVIGAYAMSRSGMMTFGGFTVGFLGSVLGIPGAVFVSGIVLTVGAILIGVYLFAPRKAEQTERPG